MKIRDVLYRAGMKWSLRKLLIMLWAVLFVPSIIVVGSFIVTSQMEIQQKEIDDLERQIRRITQRLDDKLSEIRISLHMFAGKEVIKDFSASDAAGRLELLSKTRQAIADLEYYMPIFRSCSLVVGRNAIIDGNTGRANLQTHYNVRAGLIDDFIAEPVRKTKYYYYAGDASREIEPLIAVIVPAEKEAVVFAWIDVRELIDTIGLVNEIYSIQWNDQIVQTNSLYLNHCDADDDKVVMIENRRYRVSTFAVEILDWEITIASPYSGFFEIVSGMGVSLFLALLFMLSGLLLTFSIYLCIVIPLRDIAGLMERTGDKIENPYRARSELDVLVDGINEHSRHIRQLADEVNRERMKRMQNDVERLQAMNLFLQAQINPHMLYNILESICGMAVEAGTLNIREASLTLAQLYRYCTQGPMATLEEEIASVELFKRIMNQRQEKTFSLEWNIDEEIQSLIVPRMILEPIVENAVKHGFLGGEKTGNIIWISAVYREEYLLLTVEDNGCGIELKLLEKLKSALENVCMADDLESSIGIRNVHSRIRYLYGPGFGVDVSRRAGGGTIITIALGLAPLWYMTD